MWDPVSNELCEGIYLKSSRKDSMPGWGLGQFCIPKSKKMDREGPEEARRPVRKGKGKTWLVGVGAVAMERSWR